MSLQGVAIDYDGTIGKTSERQFNWFKHWAKLNQKEIPFDNVPDFLLFYNSECELDGGVQNVYDALGLPCDMKDRNHPVWKAYTEYKHGNDVPFYPGVKETILKIWEMGHLTNDPKNNRRLRLAINTTNTWDSIYKELLKEGVLHCFDSFVTEEVLRDYQGAGNSNGIIKPSKISLALTLGLIDSVGESVLHIGDTLNDLAASYKVIRLNPSRPETLITVGAAWGYEGRKKLEQGVRVKYDGIIHFNYIIDRPEELVGIVEGLRT